MTLFVDLTSAETTSDTDEILVKQGLVYRRATLDKVNTGSINRKTFIPLAGETTTNGVLSLSRNWDDFEEIIIVYELSLTGEKSQNVFYTAIISPSDSTSAQGYLLNSYETSASLNFRSTNRDELYLFNNGDDDRIISVYGRYPK